MVDFSIPLKARIMKGQRWICIEITTKLYNLTVREYYLDGIMVLLYLLPLLCPPLHNHI